ncbi:MAG: hypothetical protein LBB22_01100 [Treponema sp.]|jgi:hypothetical protein|nr:hypothetical protein [Treponema sp.]
MKVKFKSFQIIFWMFFCRSAFSQELLRGEVSVEMEPVYAQFLGVPYPLDLTTANTWAVEDAAAAFSGMVYGWTFVYEPGERARDLQEFFDITMLGKIETDDTRLKVTDAVMDGGVFYMYSDYILDETQKTRLLAWKSASKATVKSLGFSSLQGDKGVTSRSQIKESALKDAMKTALRNRLRITERNRPRTVTGFISLSKFPIYRMQSGMWAATAEFRIEIKEIIPFAAY